MPTPLKYSIIGLQEYSISFEKYCIPCQIQQYCEFGKKKPFTIEINCTDLNQAKEKTKYEQLKKLQKTESLSTSYKDLLKKVKINLSQIFSQIWKEKVKKNELIRCLDSKKVDTLLVTQQGQDWWQDFNQTIKEINRECEKII
jgi:hypothetical protein